MAHQRLPVQPLRPREIPVPEDPELRQAYIDLGWIQLPGLFGGQPYLKWAKVGLGTPQYPGEVTVTIPERSILSTLPFQLTDMATSSLPSADPETPHYRDVVVTVTIRYERKYTGKRTRGRSYCWQAIEAEMSAPIAKDDA